MNTHKKFYILIDLDDESPRSRCQQGWFLLGPPPWLVHSCLLAVSSRGHSSVHTHPWYVHKFMCPNFLLWGYQPSWIFAQSNSFILAYLLKDCNSKHRLILRYWGLECHLLNFMESDFNPKEYIHFCTNEDTFESKKEDGWYYTETMLIKQNCLNLTGLLV